MDDKEFYDDELDLDDELVEQFSDTEPFLTARQRIEIAREERLLQSMLSDFDDWDEFDGISNFNEIENFGSYYTEQFS